MIFNLLDLLLLQERTFLKNQQLPRKWLFTKLFSPTNYSTATRCKKKFKKQKKLVPVLEHAKISYENRCLCYLLVQVRDGMRVVMHVSRAAALLLRLALRATRTAPTHQAKHMHYTVFRFNEAFVCTHNEMFLFQKNTCKKTSDAVKNVHESDRFWEEKPFGILKWVGKTTYMGRVGCAPTSAGSGTTAMIEGVDTDFCRGSRCGSRRSCSASLFALIFAKSF